MIQTRSFINSNKVVMLIIGFCSVAMAQKEINIGIEAGLSFNKYRVKLIDAWDNDMLFKTGVITGFTLELNKSKVVAFDMGVKYCMRGAREKTIITDYPFIGNSYETNTYMHFNYLSIPFHIKCKYPNELLVPYALFGINNGIFLYGKSIVKETNGGSNPYVETPIDNIKIFDFGYDIGIGLEAKLKKYSLFVELVYYDGLINISKETHNWDGVEYGMCKNRGVDIKTGIKFKKR